MQPASHDDSDGGVNFQWESEINSRCSAHFE